MKQQAKKTMSALAMLWLLMVGTGIYQAWPAQYLQHEPLPKLPAFQDCPTDFEGCFARAMRTRKNMAADRLEFSEGYASRVRNHLAVGTGVFLLPFGLCWLWRDRRIAGTNIRKLFV
jgi:hypothetical protein